MLLTFGYTNPNESNKIEDGSSFTGVDPSSIQEDTVSDNEKEDESVDNILKEYGPLTVCADRATYDSDKGTLTYFGNVFVMQIHNKHILCRKVKSPKKILFILLEIKKIHSSSFKRNGLIMLKKYVLMKRNVTLSQGRN